MQTQLQSPHRFMKSTDLWKHSIITEIMKMDEKERNEKPSDNSNNWENDTREGLADESDPETANDSVSSHGDSLTADEEKLEQVNLVSKKNGKNASSDGYNIRAPRLRPAGSKASRDALKKGVKPESGPFISTAKSTPDSSKNMKVHPNSLLETSDGADDRPIGQENKEKATLDQKIEEMENRVKKLEGELREVAALEISLYSVVPEHSSSAHKVRTPARRLSRLYIFACKYWSQDMRATVARNTVSGLVLVAKSHGNDVSRSSCRSNALAKMFESNGQEKKSETTASFLKSSTTGIDNRTSKDSYNLLMIGKNQEP